MKKSKTSIVFTGGHAGTTALVLINKIKKLEKNWEIHWIGPQKATEGGNDYSLEAKLFPGLGIIFHSISTGRLQRRFTVWTIPSLLKIPGGIFQAFKLLGKIKPKLIFSFGGFASFPVVLVGFLKKIPIIIHEQTVTVGRANKATSFFATKILLGRVESQKYFPIKKTILVGNPVYEEFFNIEKNEKTERPTVFVTGGSRGSQIINEKILDGLETLLVHFKIIHQVGDKDLLKAQKRKADLPVLLQKEYDVVGFISPEKMPYYFSKADVVVARSGANTVSELVASGKPTVFIPIPWSYLDEQTENAFWAQKYIPSIIMPQAKLEKESLIKAIDKVSTIKTSDTFDLDKIAADKIVKIIDGFIDK